MIIAPLLQDVAAGLGPLDGFREDPVMWAHQLREATAIVKPGWVVTHHDLDLEADACRGAGIDPDDLLDLELAGAAPITAALELAATLVASDRGAHVVASLTGPATLAKRLDAEDLQTCTEDAGDALAGLAAAYAERGVHAVLVWETDPVDLDAGILEAAHAPILRRLELAGVAPVLVTADRAATLGYGAVAVSVAVDAFLDGPRLTAAIAAVPAGVAAVLSEAPLPADADLGSVRGAVASAESDGSRK